MRVVKLEEMIETIENDKEHNLNEAESSYR